MRPGVTVKWPRCVSVCAGNSSLEQVINRNVLTTSLVWDGWLRRHPRLVGAALCLLSLWLGWQLQ